MSDLWSYDLSFPDHSYAAAGEGVWGETRDLVTRLMRDHYQGVSTSHFSGAISRDHSQHTV